MIYNRALNDNEIISLYSNIVSVAEINDDLKISLYPNPNNGDFIIEYSTPIAECLIKVVDVLGREIYSSAIYSNKKNIVHFSNSAGIYFINITDQNNQILSSKKLIIE